MREEKYKTYVDAQVIFQGFKSQDHLSDLLQKGSVELVERIHSAISRIELLAPNNVKKIAAEAQSKLSSYGDESKRKEFKDIVPILLQAMSEDLLETKPNKDKN